MSTESLTIKNALKAALVDLPAATDGTLVKNIVGSGEDVFDEYPTIRVVPVGLTRTSDSVNRLDDYERDFIISIYLDLGTDATVPDEDVIDTLLEIGDNVIDRLDNTDWLPTDDKRNHYSLGGDIAVGVIDTTASKTGTAVYLDIRYPVTYRTVF